MLQKYGPDSVTARRLVRAMRFVVLLVSNSEHYGPRAIPAGMASRCGGRAWGACEAVLTIRQAGLEMMLANRLAQARIDFRLSPRLMQAASGLRLSASNLRLGLHRAAAEVSEVDEPCAAMKYSERTGKSMGIKDCFARKRQPDLPNPDVIDTAEEPAKGAYETPADAAGSPEIGQPGDPQFDESLLALVREGNAWVARR